MGVKYLWDTNTAIYYDLTVLKNFIGDSVVVELEANGLAVRL